MDYYVEIKNVFEEVLRTQLNAHHIYLSGREKGFRLM